MLALIGAGVFCWCWAHASQAGRGSGAARCWPRSCPTPAPIPASVRVELRPLPEGAEVWLDGRRQPSSVLEVSTGCHAIEVRAPELETWRVEPDASRPTPS
ncbi:MAG: hypothetical protein R3B99_19150 [Polyangiales bacterium]